MSKLHDIRRRIHEDYVRELRVRASSTPSCAEATYEVLLDIAASLDAIAYEAINVGR